MTNEELEELEEAGGMLGNFHRRRRIEREVRERKIVGRDEPLAMEKRRIASTESAFFCKGHLVDEEG